MADGASGLYAGLAQGIDSGARLGLAARAQNNADQTLQIQQQELQQKDQEEKIKNQLASFQQITALYKDTHKSLRPKLWPAVANQANSLFGTKFDPNVVPDSSNEGVDAAHHEIQNFLDKKQSYGDTMTKLGYIATTLDEDQQKAVKTGADLLEKTPEGKASSNTGTYGFQGYDPATGKAVFSFSKSPTLVDSAGQTVTGPILQKGDIEKLKGEQSKIADQVSTIKGLKDILDKVPAGFAGAAEGAAGSVTGGVVFKNAKQYKDQVQSAAVEFYRAITGDTRINNNDISRALAAFPQIGDAADLRQSKYDDLVKRLNRKQQDLSRGVFSTPWDAPTADNGATDGAPKVAPPSGNAMSVISKWESKK